MLYKTDFWKNGEVKKYNFEFDSRCPDSIYIPQIKAELDKQTNSLLQRENCTWAFLGFKKKTEAEQEKNSYLFWTSLDTNKVGAGKQIPVLIQTGDGNYYVSETTTGQRTDSKGKKYVAASEHLKTADAFQEILNKSVNVYPTLEAAYDAYVKALAKDEYKGVREKCSCPTDSCAVSGITASDLASQSNQDIKALAHGSRCFYGIVRFPCHSTIRLPFPDFPCFYYVPYIDVRNKSFFVFRKFFQNMWNEHSLLIKSPKLPVGLSFGRCHPGLTGIFRRYPQFSERSRQKKPRNVTFLGFCLCRLLRWF